MSKEERIQKWQAEKEWLTKYLSRFPQCAGYPDCDGELGHGEPHDPACPCFGKTGLRRPSIPEILATFAAETKLSEPQAVPEPIDLGKEAADFHVAFHHNHGQEWLKSFVQRIQPAPDTKGLEK